MQIRTRLLKADAMIPSTPLHLPPVIFMPAKSGCLQALKNKFQERESVFLQPALADHDLVNMCKKLPSSVWDHIPALFNRQLASVVWMDFGQDPPLYCNTEFMHWFVRERACHDQLVTNELYHSLFVNWPEDSHQVEQLLQVISVYFPRELHLPGTEWFGQIVHNILIGDSTFHNEISKAVGQTAISLGMERLFWRKLLESVSKITESEREKRYYGINTILDLGFVDDLPRWPELNIECLELLVPGIDFDEAYSGEFVRFAVRTYIRLIAEQRELLSELVSRKLEVWSACLQVEELKDFDSEKSHYNSAMLNVLTTAADNHSVKACRLLGEHYRTKEQQFTENSLALMYLARAANYGDTRAQVLLSDMYRQGDADSLNLEDICRWEIHAFGQGCRSLQGRIENLSDLGDDNAQYVLGESYLQGNPKLAIDLLEKAAQKDNPDAIFRLAVLHACGDIPLNRDEAASLYKRLRDTSHTEGLHHLAMRYRQGVGVNSCIATAISLYRTCADLGDIRATYILGCLYADGGDIPADSSLARDYLLKAAVAGHIPAKQRLKRLMENNTSTTGDFSVPDTWHRT